MIKSLFVTGANGDIGQSLSEITQSSGIKFEAISRNHNTNSWTLPKEFNDLSILIHLGMPPNPRSLQDLKNYSNNTLSLAQTSLERGAQFIFVSSLSAHSGNPSRYSQIKLQTEQKVIELGGNCLKLGLFKSARPKSTYQKIKRVTRLFPDYLLSHPSALYYLTTEMLLSNWVEKTMNYKNNSVSTSVCADPIALQYNQLFKQTFHQQVRESTSFQEEITKRLSLLYHSPRSIPYWDPIINFYFGMQWSQNDNC